MLLLFSILTIRKIIEGKNMKKIILALAGLFIVISLTGCTEETTGDKVDKAIDSTKDASNSAADSIKKAFGN